MPVALNKTQLEILKLFSHLQDENELKEIKSLLVAYLSEKVVVLANDAVKDQNLTEMVFEKWKAAHFRKTA